MPVTFDYKGLAMLESIKELAENAPPFMAVTAAATKAQMNAQRIIEAVIIAVLTASVTGAIAVPVLKEQISEVIKRVDRLEGRIGANTEEIIALRERAAKTEANIENLKQKR